MIHRRVLVDGYYIGRPYGFGRFILELCRALGQAQTDFQFVVAIPATVDGSLLANYPNVLWHRLGSRNRIIWEQLLIPRLARHLGCDVIHFPYNTRALYTYGIQTVTTVHDLIFLSDKSPVWKLKAFVASEYTKWSFTNCTRKERSIISVSQTTQKVLMRMGLASSAIYNTADGFVASWKNQPKCCAARRYILHRGGSAEHRNTKRIIEAFRKAQHLLQDVDLKILGVPPEVASRWQTPGEQSVQFLPRLSDSELAALYAGSSCVIVASLQEGFGLPIIEAFGFEVPVITSNVDPMREIAGDAALLVDPLSESEIGNAMVSIMSDMYLAQSLVAKGRIQSELFASQRIAQQILDVYKQ